MKRFVLDDLQGEPIRLLLEEHLRDMRAWSPACSVHALDLDQLRQPSIRFFTLWEDEALLGCGALKALSHDSAEIKSMRAANAHRGQGIGKQILTYLIDDAKSRGIQNLYLETGSQSQFNAARQLYTRFGFAICEPFADYTLDANSCYMSRSLSEA